MRTTQESDRPGMGRGMDLGRAQSIDTLVRHREAVEQRLSSALRQAELVDGALVELDRRLADAGEVGLDHPLRASARALLVVAIGEERYDATLVPDRGDVALRVRKTLFGLQVDVVHRAAAGPPPRAPRVEGPTPEPTSSPAQPEPPQRQPREPDSRSTPR